ncbi:unnamed protein product [Cylindrotheca closterium]|uniref:Uncharacterized protein n=1 Tax=Cylindrotheca closterium TaxID=2856 RepID=A0AAD2CTL9_9STRA|nr:unnamed protein product [Cylindrotheca closterium]
MSRLLAFLLLSRFAAGARILAESDSKLPMSLSTVISDLEAEDIKALGTACFLTSRSVSKAKKAEIFGLEDLTTTAFGTDSGLCMALSPISIPEVASTAAACGGNVLFYASEEDLLRGEGLFDTLGPAMERILSGDFGSTSSLFVVADDPVSAKAKLEEAASGVLSNLVSPKKKVALLGDVFAKVEYVKNVEEAMALCETTNEPAVEQATIASAVAADFWQTTPVAIEPSMSSKDLAAARHLGPAARKALENAISTVSTMSKDKVVPNFGDLCDAATQRAMEELDEVSSPMLTASKTGKQIRENLKHDIAAAIDELCQEQLGMSQVACFDEFKQELSKLRISPNLASDMQNVVTKSVASFASKTKNMPISNANAKTAFKAQLKEFCAERLEAAQASGQFKPLPRKGVTIGLHWLLPKPFGNDFRQEPWMVHATDNLVYVPPDKITDVNPEDVASGDWRSKIVPCPSGNEMLYMQ